MTNRRKLLTFLLLIFAVSAFGQTSGVKKWSLQECIDYALQNNIQLKKTNPISRKITGAISCQNLLQEINIATKR